MRLNERAFDFDRKIADARVEQSFVGDEAPFESRRHAKDCNCDFRGALEVKRKKERDNFPTLWL